MKKQSRKALRVSRRTCPRSRVQPRGAISCPRCEVYAEACLKAHLWLAKNHEYNEATLRAVLAVLSPENPKLR